MKDQLFLGWVAISFQLISFVSQTIYGEGYFLLFNILFFLIAIISFNFELLTSKQKRGSE